MTKSVALMTVLCVLVPVGCTGGRDDAYDKAMRRLVAEQKQLDRIEKEIKEIEGDADKEDKEMTSNIHDLQFSGLPDPASQKESREIISMILDAQTKLAIKTADKIAPFLELRAGQLQRVDDARKAADEAK